MRILVVIFSIVVITVSALPLKDELLEPVHTILVNSDVNEPLIVRRSIQDESERGTRVARSPQNGQASAHSIGNTMFPGGFITAQGLAQAFHSGIGTSNAQSVSNTYNAIQNGIQVSGSYSMSQSSSSTTA